MREEKKVEAKRLVEAGGRGNLDERTHLDSAARLWVSLDLGFGLLPLGGRGRWELVAGEIAGQQGFLGFALRFTSTADSEQVP